MAEEKKNLETVVTDNNDEIRHRIRALREDLDLTMQEMANATGRSVAEDNIDYSMLVMR